LESLFRPPASVRKLTRMISGWEGRENEKRPREWESRREDK
jgi:hypothetical protein